MKKTIKIVLIVLISLMVIVLIFNFSFGYLIKSRIEKFTNESITLEYARSHARLLLGSIEFDDAILHFSEVSIDSSSYIFIESISFKKFALSHLSLKALLFDRSFNIEKVLLSGPSIDFLKDTNINPKDIFTKILTPEVVSDKSKSAPFGFEIGELEIEQGSFQLLKAARSDFSLGSVNLKLSDISMEDLKILNGDAPDLNAQFNIHMGVYDIKKDLDGGAELIIDSIIYKKDKRLFYIGGIQLDHLKSSSKFADSEISLNTNLVSVEGFSLSRLLSSKNLKFNRLTIANTEIYEKLEYFDKVKASEYEPFSKRQFVSDIINAFITDTFNLQNFNYYSDNNLSETVDRIENLNLWVYSVRVDSNFILEKEYLKTVELSTVFSGPIQMHMPENGIDISCDTLVYLGPGKDQMIACLNFDKYSSLYSESKDQPAFQFKSDSLVLSGLDEREWIDSSTMELSVYIQNPKIYGSGMNFRKSAKPGTKFILPDKIILNDLNLVNGSINITGASNKILEMESLNIEASDLEIFPKNSQSSKTVTWKNIITSFEKSKFIIPEGPLLKLEKTTINNNEVDFEGLLFAEVNNLENDNLASKKPTDSTHIFIDKAKIDNFDILAFINNKYLNIDKLTITRPALFKYTAINRMDTVSPDSISPMILYESINKALPNHVSHINIGDIQINDAHIEYQMEQNNLIYQSKFSINVRSVLFDQDLPEGKLPKLKIDQHDYCISDAKVITDNFQFISESICYSSVEDKMVIANSHVNSYLGSKSSVRSRSIEFNVDFPKIELDKLDFKPLSDGPFSFDLLHIVDPKIYIRIPQHLEAEIKTANEAASNFHPFIFLKDSIILENGKLRICLADKTDSSILLIDKVGLEIYDIYKLFGISNQRYGSTNLFSYMDFHMDHISLSNEGMNLEIGKINYDRQSGIISIDPVNQQIFSKNGNVKSRNTKNLIEIPKINIGHPDVMYVDQRIQSFGASNLIVPNISVAIESDNKKQSEEDKNIVIAPNDISLRNFLGKVDFFHLDSTVIKDVGFSFRNISDTGGGSFNIDRVSLMVDKLKIDSSHFVFHKKRIAKDIVLQLNEREVVSADSMYQFKVNNVKYYYSRDKIVIDSFKVIPRYERSEFFEKAVFQTDLIQVKFDRAVAEGIDLLSIIENKKLQMNKLTLDKFYLTDHRDQHYPRKENDFKKLPKESLFSLPFALKIDTFQVNNSFLLYGEYVDKSPDPGEIYFTNFGASIYNVSNMHTDRNEHDSLFAHITTDIMDASKMTVDFTIPLDKDDDSFWVKGNVERVNLRKFNSMTENLFGISIVRGKGVLDIPLITLTDTTSRGSVIFKYDKLKLSLYNRNKAKLSQGLGSGLVDFMLNGVLIKSNNPTFLGKTRTGEVFARRNNERSFFNYIWKSTMSGLMSSMGFNNKEQRIEIKDRKYEEKIERKYEKQMNKMNK